MKHLSQSPTDPAFVQNPYAFYARARPHGDLVWWDDYNMPMAVTYKAVNALLRDRRFGREPVEPRQFPEHLAPFYAVEAHSMLELEAPRHTRLRGLVLRAFTKRRILALQPDVAALSHQLIDAFPDGEFDLLPAFANKIPIIIICRLLGVPEEMADDLLSWSNAMVSMYQARRDRALEDAAIVATEAFVTFMRTYIEERRDSPADDLISHLIAAEEGNEKLSVDELITTCILLLNAGHEATVHSMANAVKTLIETENTSAITNIEHIDTCVEEAIRIDPPVHLFTRYAYEDIDLFGHSFKRGDEVGLLLGAANHDPLIWQNPDHFQPERKIRPNASFGAGVHFCIGAPLARIELATALPILFERCPNLCIIQPPVYENLYHFHGLSQLIVTT